MTCLKEVLSSLAGGWFKNWYVTQIESMRYKKRFPGGILESSVLFLKVLMSHQSLS